MKLYHILPYVLQKLIWVPTRLILNVFGRMEVRGLDNIKLVNHNIIFASNHSSELDPILIPAALPFWSKFSPIFYASREGKFYKHSSWRKYLYGGLLFKIWGAYPVYVGLQSYEKSLVNQIRIVNDGGNMCVFPEGKKTNDGNVQPAKGGIGYLADHTKCVVVPVGISGVYRTKILDFFLFKKEIIISFGKPIYNLELQEISATVSSDANVYKLKAQYVMNKVKGLINIPHEARDVQWVENMTEQHDY